jgi:hypothetical protein
MIYFCGYPVDGKPCGKPATPGCAFCDEHGQLFERDQFNVADLLANDTGHGPDLMERARELDYKAIGEYLGRWIRRWTVAALIVCVVGLFDPFHTWLHAHLELLLGFLLGALAQSIPWLIDRWRWKGIAWG